MNNPKRIVSEGFLLYEYLEDDNSYVLVGVIDRVMMLQGIETETGKTADEVEADDFVETGHIRYKVREFEANGGIL